MKRTSALLALALLTGCAFPMHPVQQAAQAGDPVAAQCEYEAEIAIQRIANPLYAGVRKAELMSMCMRGKGR